jgi:hypothetical protein
MVCVIGNPQYVNTSPSAWTFLLISTQRTFPTIDCF